MILFTTTVNCCSRYVYINFHINTIYTNIFRCNLTYTFVNSWRNFTFNISAGLCEFGTLASGYNVLKRQYYLQQVVYYVHYLQQQFSMVALQMQDRFKMHLCDLPQRLQYMVIDLLDLAESPHLDYGLYFLSLIFADVGKGLVD